MRTIFAFLLSSFAKRIIKRFRPMVIGITGSVGKSSTKEAVYLVLKQFQPAIRKTPSNFNNQIGLPLSIIGIDFLPGYNLWLWLKVFMLAVWRLLFSNNYPKILVLEYGIDRPGDMDQLVAIAKPDLAVLTDIGWSHLQFFADQNELANEKAKLLGSLSHAGTAIINNDNPLVVSKAGNLKNFDHLTSYGFDNLGTLTANILFEKVGINPQTKIKLNNGLELTIPAVGKAHYYACLAAIAVVKSLGYDWQLAATALTGYQPMPGRMNILKGQDQTFILDDCYNAAPNSMKEALRLLSLAEAKHKTAVIGDMLELGSATIPAHHELGKNLAEFGFDQVVIVGQYADSVKQGALTSGLSEAKISCFANSQQAADFLISHLVNGSAVLVKGSQRVRMEKIVKMIMADPSQARCFRLRLRLQSARLPPSNLEPE